MATADQATSTLNALANELRARRPDIAAFDDAYRGEHNLHFASDDFRDYFGARYKDFADNWCGIVADAPAERLQIIGIRPKGDEAKDSDLWDAWRRSESDAYSDLAFLDAIISKRAYALVWGDDEDQPSVTWEHPAQAIVGYDAETRRRKAGLKLWADGSLEYGTLYLPDEVWKFQRAYVSVDGRTNSGLYVSAAAGTGGGWVPREVPGEPWPLPNPLGVVPLVEFPNRPRLIGEPISDIAGTLSMQHAINLLWSQLFLAVDNASWPQRVITGAEMPTIPILNEEGQPIGEQPIDLKKFAVDRAIWIEDPAAKVDSWQAANLEAYTKIIDIAVGHIAAQTRTPAHYLLIGGTIANVPEGALKALETGLVKRTEEKAEHFGRAAREVFRLMALAGGDVAKADAVAVGEVLWKDVENRSDAQRADMLLKKKTIGYPLRYLLEQDGLSPVDIERVMDMVRDEASDPVLSAALREVTTPGGPQASEKPPAPTPGE